MLKKSALAICLSLMPVAASAQGYAAPGYGYSDMPGMYPNMAPPWMFQNGAPGSFPGGGQSPFITMPMTPNTGIPQAPSQPFAQPLPFWMQTPPSDPIPGTPYFAPAPNADRPAAPSTPPRWAPLPGQAPMRVMPPHRGNNWTITPLPQQNPVYAPLTPAAPATQPKWPTQF